MNAVVAASSGLVLGTAAAMLWVGLARWFADRAFWPSLQAVARTLIDGSQTPKNFARQYVHMLHRLGIYLLKIIGRVAITALPIVFGLYVLMPGLEAQQTAGAQNLEIARFDGDRALVPRSAEDDERPRPYLGELELAFWAGMLSSSLATAVVMSRMHC